MHSPTLLTEECLARRQVAAAVARACGQDEADVVIHETHISLVFVAGDRAYKLKKALVLPFLDYGTPARRRALCREEVRVNRRLAPDLYLGVAGLAPGADGYEIVGDDDPAAVDHLVVMRRFDERDTLGATLARGELTEAQVTAVGQALARFHDQARVVMADGPPALAVDRQLAANSHDLLAVVEQRAEVAQVLDLERAAHAFVATHAGTLDARAAHGRLREGHGDLRTDHVLLGESVRVVDAIEFDPALRETDVAADLAFLVMDLEAHGGGRFVPVLLGAYRAAGGDPGDDALVAFYAAHRALVRAKVHVLRAAQLPPGDAAHGHESATARDFLTLAERLAWRARLPLAIAVCGAPGSGVSALARALAERSGLPHLSAATARTRLAAFGATGHGADVDRLVHAELGHRAARAVATHGGVIIDAPLEDRADRDDLRDGFGAAAPLLWTQLVTPERVRARRLAARDRGPLTVPVTAGDAARQGAVTGQALDEVAPEALLLVRGDQSAEACVADLLALLDSRAHRPAAGAGPL